MVHFSKLKLYGFKSFIDKTELDIGPGLNGIVGPNGCGKSNLVEALRWVMGEKSAKNMRGGGMEDVIFAGTSKRPARNMAQSTVVLDNQDMNAPEPFNTTTEIEITRTIERDKGSQYRVNGKAVRARDVYLLFADTMTGANSPALVSQGRITEIIVAKPQDRRRILEESAGISGLHSRRHEAELRLNAAEKNLERLNDLIKDTKSRLSSLKRQARQAELYKELSAEIRRADMAIAWSEWTAKHQSICLERKNFEIHNQSVQQTLIEVKKQTVCLEDIEKRLPELRKNDMESRAVLQNFKISFERLEQDSKIKQNSLDQAIKNRNQMNQDIDFVKNQLYDVCERIDFITNDIKAHKILVETLPSDVEDAVLNRDKTQTELNHIRDAHSALMQDIAVTRESRQSLGREYDSSQSRLKHIEQKIKMTNDLIAQNDMDISSVEVEKNEITDLNKIKNLILIKRKELEKSETLKYTLIEKETLILSKKDSIHLTLQTLQAEKEALESLLTGYNNNSKIESEKSLLNVLNVQWQEQIQIAWSIGQTQQIKPIWFKKIVYLITLTRRNR
jgi:chromosome segregation protein